jgi:hypothetical protein
MASEIPVFRSSFVSAADEFAGKGIRPVVFDILGPDYETSLMPDDLRMVLHSNPQSMSVKYQRNVTRIQTRGGFVEQHWGDGPQTLDFEAVTGGFMRLYAGLSNITGTRFEGGRRETIAYDKYLDFLALFHNNGSVYDSRGNVVLQGIIKVTFDGGVWLGWFTSFTVTESTEKPFQFQMTATFEVHKEVVTWRSILGTTTTETVDGDSGTEQGQQALPE